MLSVFNGKHSSNGDSNFSEFVKNGAIIVDVRTVDEFNSGHIHGSINIPLDQIENKAAELKRKNKVVITCCRSGSRSGVAMSMLKEEGIECYNGGPWNVLDNKI